ncbi:DUF3037 domain-containing protein [Fibrella forsythiae]|uniref:DUF3037 domain-containing protein n=1 Tax=Fibrella forsythiae TaxID=2817061 RepID=A0ABS3JBQ0_9BACT|nr:DUF3037 domain-containing protein [Fibrella forsythiae]MBO0947407.1 DUF3037 domain-containing protein [Fibrella forsythiae]
MSEMHLFEYAVIRVVPRVEREEFINVGVVLYCASQGFLKARCTLPVERLAAFSNVPDPDEIAARLGAFEQICTGRKTGGPIGQLPVASRFRWLTATRSTIVQTSPVHPGLCADPQQTLDRLYDQLVH